MMIYDNHNAMFTKNPSIWRHCYWGWHRHPDESGCPAILEARDLLAEEYGIVGPAPWPRGCHSYNPAEFDHPEYWKCRDGRRVFVVSNYKGDSYAPHEAGMTEYHALYHPNALTWIKVFPTWQEGREWMRRTFK